MDDNKIIGIDKLMEGYSPEYDSLLKFNIHIQKQNTELKLEIAHLKDLLAASVPLIGNNINIQVPKEQAACEIQIEMINAKAKDRELSLEETKRLEILIKSLYLIKDKSKGIGITETIPTSVEELTKLATDG